jgi:hypothetical protein
MRRRPRRRDWLTAAGALAVMAGLACGPSARGRARSAEDRRAAAALVARLDALEARLVAARTLPGECADAWRGARARQRGALVFVRGDHCSVVRDLPPARPARR